MTVARSIVLLLVLGPFSLVWAGDPTQTEPFPAILSLTKPTDRPLSAAMQRLYDQWNPHEDRGNELYSNFKYTPLEGLELKANISRRDPTKVLLIDGVYHVWYTCRKAAGVPAGGKSRMRVCFIMGTTLSTRRARSSSS